MWSRSPQWAVVNFTQNLLDLRYPQFLCSLIAKFSGFWLAVRFQHISNKDWIDMHGLTKELYKRNLTLVFAQFLCFFSLDLKNNYSTVLRLTLHGISMLYVATAAILFFQFVNFTKWIRRWVIWIKKKE